MSKQLFGVSVHCPDCLSEKIFNMFKDYDKEEQTHIGFKCEDCKNSFDREDAFFIERG